MPGIDWIPLVSQVKAVVQAATGDTEGAARTMENFARECPGVSQVTSVVQLCSGDVQGAIETQEKCLGTVSNVANGIPVVGHAKGLIHHALGDHKGGDQALNAASRTTVVMATGAVAGVTTGGLAAIPAGIAAGVAYDATGSAITGKPEGYMAAIEAVIENPSAGNIIDALAIPVGDGMAGYSGGQIGNRIQLNRLENLRQAAMEKMESATTSADALKYAGEVKSLTAEINRIQNGPVNVNEPKGPKQGSIGNEPKGPKQGSIGNEPKGPKQGSIGNEPKGPKQGSIGNEPKGPKQGSIGSEPKGPKQGSIGSEPKGPNQASILKEAKIQQLEDLRNTVYEKMEFADITDGAKLKYGAELNKLTAEIDNLKHGPHFTDNPKVTPGKATPGKATAGKATAGKATAGTSAANVRVTPVTGYINEDERELGASATASATASARANINTRVEKEDAIHYDSYVEVIATAGNKRAQAQEEMRKRDKQSASGSLRESYQNVEFTTSDDLADWLGSARDPKRPRDNNWRALLRRLFNWSWLPLEMPREFNYTAVAQVNSVYTGLYHSFIRHSLEWQEVIPSLAPHVSRLAPIMREIERTTAAVTEDDARAARDEFVEALKRLRRENQNSYNDVQAAMVDIQLEQHRLLEQKLNYENYLGRSVNTNGQQRLYFQVETPSGPQVMVVCLSNNLYQPLEENTRPVKILMTVYFETLAKFISHGLLETKEEMEENKKKEMEKNKKV